MNIEITPVIFVKNIIFVKKYFYLFGELRRLLKDDNDFCLTKTTNNIYIEIENIMNLSFWFYDYFHEKRRYVLQDMETIYFDYAPDIKESDDTYKLILFHHTYFFMLFSKNEEFYKDIIKALIEIGSVSRDYLVYKEDYEILFS